MKKETRLLSYIFGTVFVLASVGDFVGHLWGRPSPHPWEWAAAFCLIGVGLLFPSQLDRLIKALPWRRGTGS